MLKGSTPSLLPNSKEEHISVAKENIALKND